MNNDNYFQVSGWMANELNLKGNELMVYAIIYGFSQDGESKFTGSINYLCKWLSCSRPTVINVLKSLVEKELISKEVINVNGVKFNKYSTLLGVKKFNDGSKKTLHGGSKKTLPNNNTIYNNKDNNRFKKPTVEEIAEYCKERKNSIDAQRFFDYYEVCNWTRGKTKIKDWKACVRTWERSDEKTQVPKSKKLSIHDYS